MKIGIIGLPKTGKKTLFELLTNHKPTEAELTANKPIIAIAEIKDSRFDKLCKIYKPKKERRARIDIEMLPDLEKDTITKGDIFTDIKELDAICHVVRAFQDDSIYHVEGSVDPSRDINLINSELILHDLMFIEKRLERIEGRAQKIKDETVLREKELLVKLKAHLDKELPLRLLKIDDEEKKIISSYPFITLKEMLVALNISESDLKDTSLIDKLKGIYKEVKMDFMQVSAKVESEIAKLESDEDKEEFLKDLNITEPAINLLTQLCIKSLNLISFFTVGPDEVRQWTIRAGSRAPEAARTIHTDLEKGFIRAEVMKYSDFDTLGSESKVKDAGKLSLKGKDYVVCDGDMLDIRFNV
ncbi:MAG: redox-regulated ATPase YchF [Candidatus Omnitrophota bacterium]